ncbi:MULTISPECIES: S8 family serine peptidase [unclassified Streptomyces]|uniref:S8 family peptidase n=1 Tax=unclassified Streptomyces TaxID=2593676 RepID=UPI001BE7CCD3|nr:MULTISPECIES: S8 family serine peptidase [unclassified Streptomyces]MBT2404266.1 S8 family serine peptidase [Streptomyces sp. ISL-21]MBT2457631.1 S8 family serine peptidase [Streptomyces sp. ISL-86]MBT2612943.1 S8 family serine peptidase [Streptomyces sp. ISL-87]
MSVTLLAGSATASVALTQAAPAQVPAAATASTPAAPVENLIVGYKSSATEASSNTAAAADAAAKGKKAGKKAKFDRRLGTGAALVNLGGATAPADAADVMAQFRADPDVAYVEPDSRAYALATPNDTEYAKQWDLFEPTAGMNVPAAWDKSTGSGVTVAVIDTGYVAHSDVAPNVVAGYDFISSSTAARDGNGRDNNPADQGDWSAAGECGTGSTASNSSWHGTHVAGTIAAATNNSMGVAGIAYNAKIQPVRVLGKCGGATSDIVDAITWASGGSVSGVPANATPAKVINMSLGGSGACTATYQNAINAAVARGTTVVVAAGNSNSDASGFSPASCNNVINVAATNRTGDRSFYSNYGAIIDVAAPGGETRRATDTPGTVTTPENGILSTLNSGTTTPGSEIYKPYQGTSMAAPHVAGLAALVVAAKPSLTPAQVESAIKANTRPLAGTCTGGCGTGLADAAATVNAVLSTPVTPVFSNTTDVAIPDNGGAVSSSIAVSGLTGNAPAALKVSVDIKHTYRGDLVIDLVAPNGTVKRLQNSSGDSADNVITTYTVDASALAANGTWQLRVQDVAAADTGYIDSWSLGF